MTRAKGPKMTASRERPWSLLAAAPVKTASELRVALAVDVPFPDTNRAVEGTRLLLGAVAGEVAGVEVVPLRVETDTPPTVVLPDAAAVAPPFVAGVPELIATTVGTLMVVTELVPALNVTREVGTEPAKEGVVLVTDRVTSWFAVEVDSLAVETGYVVVYSATLASVTFPIGQSVTVGAHDVIV